MGKGKLEKFEGDYAPGKPPVEEITGVGIDPLALQIEDDISSLFDANKLWALLKLFPEECFISPEDARELRTRVTEGLLSLDHTLDQEIITFPATLRSAESARKDLRSARERAKHAASASTSATTRAATALRQAEYRCKVYRAKEEVAAGCESLKAGKVTQASIHFYRAFELGAHSFAFSAMRSQKRTGSRSHAKSAPAQKLEPIKVTIHETWKRAYPAIEAEFKKTGVDPNQHRPAIEQEVFEHICKLAKDGRIKVPVKWLENPQDLRRKLRGILIDLGLTQRNPKRGRPRHSPLRSTPTQRK
jgi:hypothetical protein